MREYEQQFVDLLKERPVDRKLLCKTASFFLNAFGIHMDEMAAEIEADAGAKALMDEISWHWINRAEIQSRVRWNYDDRNRLSYEICQNLCNTLSGEKIPTLASDEKCVGYELAVYMSREHRTIQQSFTGFVFTYLTATNEDFRKMTKEAGYNKLGKLIMI